MFEPLFKNQPTKTAKIWDEQDIKYFIQSYLRDNCKTEQIYCTGVATGIVHLRVGSPTLKQMMFLLEYELSLELKTQAGYKLKKLKVQLV